MPSRGVLEAGRGPSLVRVTTPDNLELALEGLVRKVLKEQPKQEDLYSFAADYFEALVVIRDKAENPNLGVHEICPTRSEAEANELIKLATSFAKPAFLAKSLECCNVVDIDAVRGKDVVETTKITEIDDSEQAAGLEETEHEEKFADLVENQDITAETEGVDVLATLDLEGIETEDKPAETLETEEKAERTAQVEKLMETLETEEQVQETEPLEQLTETLEDEEQAGNVIEAGSLESERVEVAETSLGALEGPEKPLESVMDDLQSDDATERMETVENLPETLREKVGDDLEDQECAEKEEKVETGILEDEEVAERVETSMLEDQKVETIAPDSSENQGVEVENVGKVEAGKLEDQEVPEKVETIATDASENQDVEVENVGKVETGKLEDQEAPEKVESIATDASENQDVEVENVVKVETGNLEDQNVSEKFETVETGIMEDLRENPDISAAENPTDGLENTQQLSETLVCDEENVLETRTVSEVLQTSDIQVSEESENGRVEKLQPTGEDIQEPEEKLAATETEISESASNREPGDDLSEKSSERLDNAETPELENEELAKQANQDSSPSDETGDQMTRSEPGENQESDEAQGEKKLNDVVSEAESLNNPETPLVVAPLAAAPIDSEPVETAQDAGSEIAKESEERDIIKEFIEREQEFSTMGNSTRSLEVAQVHLEDPLSDISSEVNSSGLIGGALIENSVFEDEPKQESIGGLIGGVASIKNENEENIEAISADSLELIPPSTDDKIPKNEPVVPLDPETTEITTENEPELSTEPCEIDLPEIVERASAVVDDVLQEAVAQQNDENLQIEVGLIPDEDNVPGKQVSDESGSNVSSKESDSMEDANPFISAEVKTLVPPAEAPAVTETDSQEDEADVIIPLQAEIGVIQEMDEGAWDAQLTFVRAALIIQKNFRRYLQRKRNNESLGSLTRSEEAEKGSTSTDSSLSSSATKIRQSRTLESSKSDATSSFNETKLITDKATSMSTVPDSEIWGALEHELEESGLVQQNSNRQKLRREDAVQITATASEDSGTASPKMERLLGTGELHDMVLPEEN